MGPNASDIGRTSTHRGVASWVSSATNKGGTGVAQTMRTARFVTEWDTAPNPAYDIWTSVNGSEIVPGVVSPLVASTFNRYDYLSLKRLMATYPNGDKATLV